MLELPSELTATHRRNLAYFDKNFPDIHRRIVGHNPTPEYLLRLRDNRYFDIQNANTKTFLYNADPQPLARKSAEFICQTKGNYLAYSADRHALEKSFPPIPALDRIHDYVKQCTVNSRLGGPPRKIISFGVGLGLQIVEFAKISSLRALLVIEPNIEFFRFSTYFVDYASVGTRKSLFFAVGQDLHEALFAFTRDQSVYNYSIKLSLIFTEYEYLARQVQHYIAVRGDFDAEHRLAVAINGVGNRFRYPPLDLTKDRQVDDPVLLLASGPSLEKNLAFVKNAQGRFLVCCAGSCLELLAKEDIRVDVCFSLDAKAEIAEQFRNVPQEVLDKTLFIVDEQTDIQVTDLLRQIIIGEKPSVPTSTVCHYALFLLCKLGFGKIYTLGIDAALSDERNEYSGGVVVATKNTAVIEDQAFEIRGNLRAKVWSNYKLSMYLRNYKKFSEIFSGRKIYNLSDGAYIDGFAPLGMGDIKLTEFVDLDKEKVLALFHTKSQYKRDIVRNRQRIAVADKLLALIETHVAALDARSFGPGTIDELIEMRSDRFLAEFSVVCDQDLELSGTIRSYLFAVDYQVLQMLDNRNLSDFTGHARRLYSLWLDGLVEIIERYRAALIRQRESSIPKA